MRLKDEWEKKQVKYRKHKTEVSHGRADTF